MIKDNVGRWVAAGAAGSLLTLMTFLAPIEGEVRSVYKDVGDVATVCLGSTRFVNGQSTYTAEECAEMYAKDAGEFLRHVQRSAPADTPESVLVAMASVAYNVGTRGYDQSPMKPLVQAGAYQAACEAIVAPWVTSKGVAKGYRATVQLRPHKGLENRRQREYEQCVSGL